MRAYHAVMRHWRLAVEATARGQRALSRRVIVMLARVVQKTKLLRALAARIDCDRTLRLKRQCLSNWRSATTQTRLTVFAFAVRLQVCMSDVQFGAH